MFLKALLVGRYFVFLQSHHELFNTASRLLELHVDDRIRDPIP